LLDWRPISKGTLLGFAKVQFSSGMIVSEIAIHRTGTRMWAAPPSRPWIENNALVIGENGRPRYQPIISFANHGVQGSWSRQVLNALCEEHPDLFPTVAEDRLDLGPSYGSAR
jgi:hypothetical protein